MDNFNPATDVKNSALLLSRFREWPSFHDAEIISIDLDANGEPSLEAAIHMWGLTGDVDERGYYRTKNHAVVTMRFTNVIVYELKDWGRQNVIYELRISVIRDGNRQYSVDVSPSNGCDARFDCDEIELVSVRPWTGKGL